MDPDEAEAFGIEQCIAQTSELLRCGVPGIHFYVLNKSRHMGDILDDVSF